MQILTDQFQKELKEHGNYQFPLLISPERLSKYETGSFLWHWHPELEFTLVVKGQMQYQVNQITYHLQQGSGLFVNTASLHSGRMIQNQECEYISVTFDPKLLYGYENSIIFSKYVHPILKNFSLSSIFFDLSEEWHSSVLVNLEEMIRIGQTQDPAYEFDLLAKLQYLWQSIYLNHNQTLSINNTSKKNYDRMRRILSYIELNYASKISLEEIAATIPICKSECCRMFKKYMNISLFDFLLQYRIEKSTFYLRTTKFSVTEIALLVGFVDSNYYTRVFHKQKGMSPTKYRQVMAG